MAENLNRLWVLISSKDAEQCVGAISIGPVPNVVEHVASDAFVAMISFARLGAGALRRYPDGREFYVMPILDGPTKNRSRWRPVASMEEAVQLLSQEKEALLAAGWVERDFDPVNDPD
jgi:hypothetical protein